MVGAGSDASGFSGRLRKLAAEPLLHLVRTKPGSRRQTGLIAAAHGCPDQYSGDRRGAESLGRRRGTYLWVNGLR